MVNYPLVSIIIPIKNDSRKLEKCLKSIKNQSYKNIEVLVNDDKINPSLENKKIVNRFNTKKLKVIYLNKNEGMSQARHTGFLASKGEYILHLDSDMTLQRDVAEKAVEKMKGYGGLIIPEKSIANDYWGKCRSLERTCYLGDESIECARFFSRQAYEKIGYHDDSLVFSEDRDVHIRIKQAGYNIGRINAYIYHHEGKNKLISQFKKRFFYGKTGERYVKKHPLAAIKQANVLFRPAYLRNWKLLLKHPGLTIGMFTLRILELTAFTGGMIYNKFLKK